MLFVRDGFVDHGVAVGTLYPCEPFLACTMSCAAVSNVKRYSHSLVTGYVDASMYKGQETRLGYWSPTICGPDFCGAEVQRVGAPFLR